MSMFGSLFRRKTFYVKLFFNRTKQTCCATHMASNTAYFRYVTNEPEFHVSLRLNLTQSAFSIDKQFNFCRRITEPCSAFLTRVHTNVEKVMNKKMRNRGKKKNEDVLISEVNAEPPGRVSLHKDGIPVEDTTLCSEIFTSSAEFTLHVFDCVLPVVINSPWIESFALPKSIMAGFYVYPCKVEQFFVDIDRSEWTWSRSKAEKGPWEVCGTSWLYETVTADVGHFLKLYCIPKNADGRIGPAVDSVSQVVVDAGPGPLPCEIKHKFTPCVLENGTFRVVSYNILADLYVDSENSRTVLFGYCPAYALDLAYRRQLWIKELVGYNADIICLQEVDGKVFRHDLEPVFKRIGFRGEFCPKGEVSEGTALLYRESKLNPIESWRVVLGKALQTDTLLLDLWDKVRLNPNLATHMTELATTLQIQLFDCLSINPNKMLLVANTHLYFHPDADGIRLLQATIIITYLQQLLQHLKKVNDKEIVLVLCGDFNSVPECGIYSLFTTGTVSEDHIDWRSNAEEAVVGVSCKHSFSLASACGTPTFTNYTVEFKDCLDYIFYEKDKMEVVKVVPLPTEEELAQHLAIPSIVMPSDHIALVSDVRFIK